MLSGQCETLIVGVCGFARITSVALRAVTSRFRRLSNQIRPHRRTLHALGWRRRVSLSRPADFSSHATRAIAPVTAIRCKSGTAPTPICAGGFTKRGERHPENRCLGKAIDGIAPLARLRGPHSVEGSRKHKGVPVKAGVPLSTGCHRHRLLVFPVL